MNRHRSFLLGCGMHGGYDELSFPGWELALLWPLSSRSVTDRPLRPRARLLPETAQHPDVPRDCSLNGWGGPQKPTPFLVSLKCLSLPGPLTSPPESQPSSSPSGKPLPWFLLCSRALRVSRLTTTGLVWASSRPPYLRAPPIPSPLLADPGGRKTLTPPFLGSLLLSLAACRLPISSSGFWGRECSEAWGTVVRGTSLPAPRLPEKTVYRNHEATVPLTWSQAHKAA